MSWAFVAVSVIGAVVSSKEANAQADAQIEQAKIDQKISDNETQMAMEEQVRADGVELSNKRREALRTKANIVAQSANTGVAGVSSDRLKRNVDFQEQFDINTIKANNRAKLMNISQQGVTNSQQINATINNASANKVSNSAMIGKATLSGLSAYASVSK